MVITMESYLGGAASVQHRGAKPPGRSRRERSQGSAAMRCREEAGSLDLAGRHLSRNDGRVSIPRTKPSFLVPQGSWRTTNAVRPPGAKVRPAFMPGKGFGYAPEAGTATPWPRPQGCRQRQSTPSGLDAGKAKPPSDSSGFASSRDKLASAKKRSLTPGLPPRTVPPRGEKCCPVGADSPFLGHVSVLHRNRTLPRAVGVARCGKAARRSSMRN